MQHGRTPDQVIALAVVLLLHIAALCAHARRQAGPGNVLGCHRCRGGLIADHALPLGQLLGQRHADMARATAQIQQTPGGRQRAELRQQMLNGWHRYRALLLRNLHPGCLGPAAGWRRHCDLAMFQPLRPLRSQAGQGLLAVLPGLAAVVGRSFQKIALGQRGAAKQCLAGGAVSRIRSLLAVEQVHAPQQLQPDGTGARVQAQAFCDGACAGRLAQVRKELVRQRLLQCLALQRDGGQTPERLQRVFGLEIHAHAQASVLDGWARAMSMDGGRCAMVVLCSEVDTELSL